MHTLHKHATFLAICLSGLAGCVDSIGFLQLGGSYVAFMSGNSTQFAVQLALGHTRVALFLGAIILLFVLGVVLGSVVHQRAKTPPVAVLTLVTLLLGLAAASYSQGWFYPTIILMTLSMGAENAVFQRGGEVVVGLTYMTGTLVKVGQRIAAAFFGGPAFAFAPFLLLWCGLISGGVIGALLFTGFGLNSLWVVFAWSGALTLVAYKVHPSLK